MLFGSLCLVVLVQGRVACLVFCGQRFEAFAGAGAYWMELTSVVVCGCLWLYGWLSSRCTVGSIATRGIRLIAVVTLLPARL